jgi:hypothetical protein
MTSTFIIVLRAPSSALLLPDEGFEINFPQQATRVRLRTQWQDRWLEHPVPGDLWVEVNGESASLDAAVQHHASLARGVATMFAFVANAAVEPLDVELAYDATEGRTDREYLQVFIREASPIPKGGRVVQTQRLQPAFDALLALPPTPRLQRALFHYDLALRNWQLGREYQSLDHLWIAAENIVEPIIDQRTGNTDRREFARSLGIAVDRETPEVPKPRWRSALKSWGLRELVFEGDRGAYDAARTATDGYEHGFLDLNDVQRQAVEATESVFAYVRRSIADVLSLTREYREWLLSRTPVDVASTRKLVRGLLVGDVADPNRLAAPDQEYPILRWRTRLSRFARDGDQFDASFTERMTVNVGEGVQFQGQAIEVRGRAALGAEVKVQTVTPSVGLDTENLTLEALVDFLGRAGHAVTGGLDAVPVSGPEGLALFGILSHCAALLETVTLLIRDRRGIEALSIAARLFEQATVLRWLADDGERLSDWFSQWRAVSLHDLVLLAEAETETGRREEERAEVRQLRERAADLPDYPPWPPGEAWLRDQAFEQERQRLWWLWRLDRHLHWHERLLDARFTEEPTIGFKTREENLDDLAEIAAFAVEAATMARIAVGSILEVEPPAVLDQVVNETQQILTRIPR